MILGMTVLVFSIIVGIKRRAWNHPLLVFILISCVLSLACDLIAIYVGLVLGRITVGIIHLWSVIELACLSGFFLLFLKSKKFLLKGSLVIVSAFTLVNVMFIQHEIPIAWYSNGLIALLFITLSIWALGELFNREESAHLTSLPAFWVIIGVLLYFSGSMFSTLLSAQILSSEKTTVFGMWYMHNSILMVKNVLFGIAFTKIAMR